jgi:hypothetical protein
VSRHIGWTERHSFGPVNLRHIADVLDRLNHEQAMIGMMWDVDVVAPKQVWEAADGAEDEQRPGITAEAQAWLTAHPDPHDVPSRPITAIGQAAQIITTWLKNEESIDPGTIGDNEGYLIVDKLLKEGFEIVRAANPAEARREAIVLNHLARHTAGYSDQTVTAELLDQLRDEGLLSE